MNCYTTPTQIKNRLGLGVTTYDAQLLRLCEQASRAVDRFCHRQFFIESGTRVFYPVAPWVLPVADVLSVSSLGVDTDEDGDVDTAWAAGDYRLEPANAYPKTRVYPTVSGGRSFTESLPVRIVGVWGHGDGSGSPFWSLGITLTATNGTTTSVSVSSAVPIEAGMTLLAGEEQMFVESLSGTTLTVRRAVNGTTGAAHTAAAASVAVYPPELAITLEGAICRLWNFRARVGLRSERIGDYSYEASGGMAPGSWFLPDEEAALQRLRRRF